MEWRVAAAVLCSVAAAVCYATSNVLEQREAELVPAEHALRVQLIAHLVRRPLWVLGFLSDAGGYVFEALALGVGALVFVQPILATGLLLSLFLGALVDHRPVGRAGWAAALALAGGVALFLYEVSPTGGHPVAPLSSWFEVGLPFGGLIAVGIGVGSLTHGTARAVFLGIAAGACFGLSSALTKGFVSFLGDGVFAWVGHWEPYALAVFAISGLVIGQSAFQTGSLAASLGALEVMGPVCGAVLGVGVLGEHVDTGGPGSMVAVVASVVAMAWGVVALARVEHPAPPRPAPVPGKPATAN